MNFKTLRNTLVASALLGIGGIANADQIDITSISASWINILPTSGITVVSSGDEAEMRWGTPASDAGQSGYLFDSTNTPFSVNVPPDAQFDLGDFTHFNNPIFAPSLTSATLQLTVGIVIEGVNIGNQVFTYDFVHNETPNGDDPCANGEPNGSGVNVNGCADIVTLTNNVLLSDTFNVGGDVYTLLIDGFSVGGVLLNSFQTVEGQDNTATLVARIGVAEGVNVSEPATLALLGLGLLGTAAAARRRRKL